MKEQPLFAPGQEIVCVDSKDSEYLIEGNSYKALEFDHCEGCGSVGVYVGICQKDKNGSGLFSHRCICGFVSPPTTDNRMFYRQNRFIPASFDRYAEETFHQSLKGKPVNA